MTATTVGDEPATAAIAHGYMDAAGTAAPAFSASWVYADGDVVSTASDVARFDVALMNGRLVKPSTFALCNRARSTLRRWARACGMVSGSRWSPKAA